MTWNQFRPEWSEITCDPARICDAKSEFIDGVWSLFEGLAHLETKESSPSKGEICACRGSKILDGWGNYRVGTSYDSRRFAGLNWR